MDSDPPPRTAASQPFTDDSTAADSGEDPFSQHPFQATGSALAGVLIALLALALPLASVMGDRPPNSMRMAATLAVTVQAVVGPGVAEPIAGLFSPFRPP